MLVALAYPPILIGTENCDWNIGKVYHMGIVCLVLKKKKKKEYFDLRQVYQEIQSQIKTTILLNYFG